MTRFYQLLSTAAALLCVLAACSYYGEERDNRKLLSSAAYRLDAEPQQSLTQLLEVNASLLSEQEYAYYTLLHARARNLTGANIAALEESILEAKRTILSDYHPAKAAFACFVTGRMYEAQGKPQYAIYEYLQADDWASKAKCYLPEIAYSDIPYNLAALYFDEQAYDKASTYINKALNAIEGKEYKYTKELHALELKGLILKSLTKRDSALIYYDKALVIARQHNDNASKNRILYNKNMLLYYAKNYPVAEEICKQLLPTYINDNDSICIGAVYLALAIICDKTSRPSEAYTYAYKAKEVSENLSDNFMLSTYEMLHKVEKSSGNSVKAAGFKQQFDKLKNEIATSRAEQRAEIERKAALAKQQGETAKEVMLVVASNRTHYKQQLTAKRVAIGVSIGILLLAAAVLHLRQRKRMDEDRNICREEMMLYISQRKNLAKVIRELDSWNDFNHKNQALDMLENLEITLKMSPQLDRSYGKLYSKLRESYPNFTSAELEMLWLSLTKTLKQTELRAYLDCSAFEFYHTWQSVIEKLRKERRKLIRVNGIFVNIPEQDFPVDDEDIPYSK